MPIRSGGAGDGWAALDMWAALVDLILPAPCAGCASTGRGGPLCAECAEALAGAIPQRVHPDHEPSGLRCLALAAYAGALRGAILAYKERGRYGLVTALGDRLADVVVAGLGNAPAAGPVVLVPVPSTAAAARQRHGDHLARLARRAADRLRRAGWVAGVAYPLRARPRPDSAGMSGADRALLARGAFAPVPARVAALRSAAAAGARVVLVDDVVTTGATVAAAVARLRAGGLEIPLAAVLAATLRRSDSAPIPPSAAPYRSVGNLSPNEW